MDATRAPARTPPRAAPTAEDQALRQTFGFSEADVGFVREADTAAPLTKHVNLFCNAEGEFDAGTIAAGYRRLGNSWGASWFNGIAIKLGLWWSTASRANAFAGEAMTAANIAAFIHPPGRSGIFDQEGYVDLPVFSKIWDKYQQDGQMPIAQLRAISLDEGQGTTGSKGEFNALVTEMERRGKAVLTQKEFVEFYSGDLLQTWADA